MNPKAVHRAWLKKEHAIEAQGLTRTGGMSGFLPDFTPVSLVFP